MVDENNNPSTEKINHSVQACLDKEQLLRLALQETLELIAATADISHGCLSLGDGIGALYHLRRLWVHFKTIPETADEFKAVLAEKAHFEREAIK